MKKLTDQHHLDPPCPLFQIFPELQAEYTQSTKCAFAASHFAHCEEKVNGCNGYHSEDCVEEL